MIDTFSDTYFNYVQKAFEEFKSITSDGGEFLSFLVVDNQKVTGRISNLKGRTVFNSTDLFVSKETQSETLSRMEYLFDIIHNHIANFNEDVLNKKGDYSELIYNYLDDNVEFLSSFELVVNNAGQNLAMYIKGYETKNTYDLVRLCEIPDYNLSDVIFMDMLAKDLASNNSEINYNLELPISLINGVKSKPNVY